MNPFDSVSAAKEAVVDYGDAEFHVVSPGSYVTCAITAKRINLTDLRYWNVDSQEPYADADAAMKGFGYGVGL